MEGYYIYINQILELSMILDNEKFQKVLDRAYNRNNYLKENKNAYLDQLLASKGITVLYRDSQYKKKVTLIVNSSLVLGFDKTDSGQLIRKLDKHIEAYFDGRYGLNDFALSGMIFAADINVHDCENVAAYLKVLQRIGKVKGFSKSGYDCYGESDSFCLKGNSNGIELLIYDLEGFFKKAIKKKDDNRKKLKSVVEKTKGILRAEVRLIKPKAIRRCTNAIDIVNQIAELSEESQDIFLETFTRIIPFGDYYKKDKAVEIIRSEVEDSVLRKEMLRLLVLIPEKKSLYLAQKAMNCRNIQKVMERFAEINVSPITISKRQDVKYLENIFEYLFEKS